jgi:hypothetical protein
MYIFALCYRILLNNITKIPLAVIDKDDDLVTCRRAELVELDGLGLFPNLSVSKVL